ncbi:MAG: sugar transferase [Clostridia bacterium]|nr:sugar transferase [Clostridia bacterium]
MTLKKKPFYEFCKRVMDILCSGLAIVVLSPLMLVVALLVRSDGGPAFFKQVRVGKDGKLFRIYKFRSMCVDADSPEMLAKLAALNEMDGPAFKIKNDPRITKVGRFIRRTSIDELPQLFNIFRGDMTIVGPRPPLEREVAQYTDYQRQRLLVKQGLTCYWQCSGRNNISFEEWVELDLKYIRERSLWTDIKIIFKTIPAVLSGDGAG